MGPIVAYNGHITVADISELNSIAEISKFDGMEATVHDASADARVYAGLAIYKWKSEISRWLLIFIERAPDEVHLRIETLEIVGGQVTAMYEPRDSVIFDAMVVDPTTRTLLTVVSCTCTGAVINIGNTAYYDGKLLQFSYFYGGIIGTGNSGPKGDRGDTGPVGPVGPTGPQGLQGSTGLQGSAGVAGVDGLYFKGDWDSTVQYTVRDVVYHEGSSWRASANTVVGDVPSLMAVNWAVVAVRGADGVDGQPGITGPQGPQGISGADGLDGSIGPVGTVGGMGLQGPIGPTGASGLVFTGMWDSSAIYDVGYVVYYGGVSWFASTVPSMGEIPATTSVNWFPLSLHGVNGADGPQGPQGASGPQGVAGPRGLTGDTGITGPQGAAGSQGVTGDTGVAGPQGPVGATGVTVAKTINGESILTTGNLDVATLVGGTVPVNQLPGCVYSSMSAFPLTGDLGRLYVAADTSLIYRWTGVTYGGVKTSGDTAVVSETIRFNFTGADLTDTIGVIPWYPERAVSIKGLYLSLGLPSSSPISVTLVKNGVDIYTCQLPADTVKSSIFNITDVSLLETDYLKTNIAASGGRDLVITLIYL